MPSRGGRQRGAAPLPVRRSAAVSRAAAAKTAGGGSQAGAATLREETAAAQHCMPHCAVLLPPPSPHASALPAPTCQGRILRDRQRCLDLASALKAPQQLAHDALLRQQLRGTRGAQPDRGRPAAPGGRLVGQLCRSHRIACETTCTGIRSLQSEVFTPVDHSPPQGQLQQPAGTGHSLLLLVTRRAPAGRQRRRQRHCSIHLRACAAPDASQHSTACSPTHHLPARPRLAKVTRPPPIHPPTWHPA